jgi:hypothetical protein
MNAGAGDPAKTRLRRVPGGQGFLRHGPLTHAGTLAHTRRDEFASRRRRVAAMRARREAMQARISFPPSSFCGNFSSFFRPGCLQRRNASSHSRRAPSPNRLFGSKCRNASSRFLGPRSPGDCASLLRRKNHAQRGPARNNLLPASSHCRSTSSHCGNSFSHCRHSSTQVRRTDSRARANASACGEATSTRRRTRRDGRNARWRRLSATREVVSGSKSNVAGSRHPRLESSRRHAWSPSHGGLAQGLLPRHSCRGAWF